MYMYMCVHTLIYEMHITWLVSIEKESALLRFFKLHSATSSIPMYLYIHIYIYTCTNIYTYIYINTYICKFRHLADFR